MTAAELADWTPGERLADAQLLMLQAIYHELHHGHDQAAAHTMALAEHSTALNEHASALDSAISGGRNSNSGHSRGRRILLGLLGACNR